MKRRRVPVRGQRGNTFSLQSYEKGGGKGGQKIPWGSAQPNYRGGPFSRREGKFLKILNFPKRRKEREGAKVSNGAANRLFPLKP